MNHHCLFLAISLLFTGGVCFAQTPRDFAVDLQATVAPSVPRLTLNWTQRLQSKVSAQSVYRRVKGEVMWELQATLGTSDTSYADHTAEAGVLYEYWMKRDFSGYSQSMGYLTAGVEVPMTEARGTALLVVDDTMLTTMAPEVAEVARDLAGDGWTVQVIPAPRTGTAASIRPLIQSAYYADPANVKMVYLFGHVPVPYSGSIAPDGHFDHLGAWPADPYYGEMDGTWTDTSVNNTGAPGTRNDNVPGDGKFDPSILSGLLSPVELMVGRVDLSGMTRAPTSNVTEQALLRRYVRKSHNYRHKLGAYANVPRRALIRDGFGYFSGENIAVSGWAWAFTGLGRPPDITIDEAPIGQWWNYAASNTYLIGSGCGYGSYESSDTVGTTMNFGHRPSKVIFTCLFGSYFGDWDSPNNLMRAVLAGNASGDSLGLSCMWAGRPQIFMHSMGMGETLGYASRTTQNANSYAVTSPLLAPLGAGAGGVHMGLMGDPSLRLHMVEPPRNLALRDTGSEIVLKWSASTEPGVVGYHVYRGNAETGPFTRLTTVPQAATTYTDPVTVPLGSTGVYLVRTLKLESAPGGSYYNLSQGAMLVLAPTVLGGGATGAYNPSSLTVTHHGSTNTQVAWVDNSTDELGFRIERKTNYNGTWTAVGTTSADTTTFTDPGPLAHGSTYYYRVFTTGPAGDSLPSTEVSFDGVGGYFELPVTTMKVSKNAGQATLTVNRFNGATGQVSLNYATTNSSAIAGTHFIATSGTLTWADGETGPKTVNVPIINTPTPQQPRQFKFAISNPTGGTVIELASSAAVLIEDPGATLPAAWAQTVLGSVTDSSPVVEAEGVIASALIGGAGLFTSTYSDAGRFVYQTRAGDGSMTMFVPTPVPAHPAGRFAIMARASLAANDITAAAVTSGDATGYGAKLATRSTVGAVCTLLPAANNNHTTPRWLRLTRAGNNFTAESSADGNTWVLLGTSTAVMPATAYWGMFHISASLSTANIGDYQTAVFQNISFGSPPAPIAPTGLAASYGSAAPSNSLSWTAPTYASGYRVQRRVEGGVFADIATVSSGTTYEDTGISIDTAYEYRVLAYNTTGDGPVSSVARVTTPHDATVVNRTAAGVNGADATVRYDTPVGTFGAQTTVTITGSHINSSAPTPVTKTWLRFDLSGLGPPKSATLKLTLVSHNLQPTFDIGGYFSAYVRMLSEASDTWDENTITWNNAPQNGTTGLGTTGSTYSLGTIDYLNIDEVPAADSEGRYPLTVSQLYNNIGVNDLATITIVPYGKSGPVSFASGEHATLAPPTLELVYPTSQTKPSFLTATPDASSGINLAWMDNSTTETGYLIERRPRHGTFALLQNVAANSVAFSDTTAQSGVIYEYSVCATGLPADSSWSATASAAAPGTSTGYQLWLQANGLPMDASASGAPGAFPMSDGIANLMRHALGLSSSTRGYAGRLEHGTINVSGSDYLTLTYTRPEPALSGITYIVEACSDLAAWSTDGLVQVRSTVNADLRTITLRDGTTIVGGAKRFLRLRVTQP